MEIFAEDIFSVGHPSFARLGRSREMAVAELFANHYSNLILDEVKIYQNGGSEVNANNYRIDIAGNSYLYKNFRTLNDVGMLAHLQDLDFSALLKHLNMGHVFFFNVCL